MKAPRIDMTGQMFGRLTVKSCAGQKRGRGEYFWNCVCECGVSAVVSGYKLRTGHTKSCGCLMPEITGNTHRKHGMRFSPEYAAWCCIKKRCDDTDGVGYEYWGGRGIGMCDEWRESFQAFYDHVGPRPGSRYSIDRIDNSRGYEPGNVRWATPLQQSQNRRFVKQYSLEGKTQCLTEWCREKGVPYNRVFHRLRDGWTFERALLAPPRKTKLTRYWAA